jgi:hypothetical protein
MKFLNLINSFLRSKPESGISFELREGEGCRLAGLSNGLFDVLAYRNRSVFLRLSLGSRLPTQQCGTESDTAVLLLVQAQAHLSVNILVFSNVLFSH